MLRKIYKILLDSLFPPRCIVCGEEGHLLCKNCANQIIPLEQQVCPACKQKSVRGATCLHCKTKTNLDGLIVWASYSHNPNLKKIITQSKYIGYQDTLEILGNLLVRRLNEEHLGKIILVPIPLHWRRMWYRGFNQAEVLLHSVKDRSLVRDLLKRTRYTVPQVKVATRTDRLQNMQNVFMCEDDLSEDSEIFVLVDDVCSTGATLEDCARALKKSGAKKVYGLVLARG